jgi:hypothetical protein
MPCSRKIFGKTCNFHLMAIPSGKNGESHVYAHSQHNDHPFLSEGEWCGGGGGASFSKKNFFQLKNL